MIASRLWYLVLGIALGFLTFLLFVGASMFDRTSRRTMSESLSGDAQVVSWYIKDDARKRSSALINFALDAELGAALAKSSGAPDKAPGDARDRAKKLLKSVDDKLPADLKFTSLFAVDQYGRVIAQLGFDQASGIEDFELGGYPVVADALHGWVRDDAWVLDGRIYRVVARPVETDPSQPPAGAIVGARIIDDSFARELTKRTGAAVAFFAGGTRVAAAAPEGFDASQLDAITSDLGALQNDPSYRDKGRSDVRLLQNTIGVVYTAIPGESWALGAGFAVGRNAFLVGSPLGFLQKGDDEDKRSAKLPVVIGIALGAALLGLLFSILEHTRPLNTFRSEAQRFARGDTDQLAPSKFLGTFRKIASDVNDGIEKAVAKGGGTRKAADLAQVLGPIPAQPAMSAFSFPGPESDSGARRIEASGSHHISFPGKPEISGSHAIPFNGPGSGTGGSRPGPPPPRNSPAEPISLGALDLPSGGPRKPPPKPARPPEDPSPFEAMEESERTVISKVPQDLLDQTAGHRVAGGEDGDSPEWPTVFDEFLRVKRENGESVEGLTFEKFRTTLRKNRDQLIQRHGCNRVKFTVYVKEGRAALKASPVKD